MKILPKVSALAVCLVAFMPGYTAAQRLTGEWSGQLKVTPQMKLKLVLHIEDKAVYLDSPDQGAYGIQGDIVFLSDDSVNITLPKLMAGYAGSLKGDTLSGEFSQGGLHMPLQLTRGVEKAVRPQTPQPPFPYSTEELKIHTDNAIIAGTLTMPEDAGKKTPLVVMVTGSGQQNRDEELFGHKPFAVIADFLARNGIASFRYDDRGVGESTGDPLSATTEDFAADAAAAVAYLKETGRFGKTGILGHSEGGMIAYMLGARPKTIDFIISVAGPSIKGSKTIGYQNKMALIKAGIPEKEAEDFSKAIEAIFDYRTANPEAGEISDEQLMEFYPQYKDSPLTIHLGGSIKIRMANSPEDSNPWMRYFLAYDPAADLKRLKIPTFIIYGEKDRQVPPSLNVGPARLLAPKATVKEYPGLNHMMQHALTGEVNEYAEIEETISPEVLESIADFIRLMVK